ncbi:hypothetical protein [uncultured Enterovirga sp.]|uniref:hypothetical protein n=1 Tax=uncultured Enterovirga sp. TaxID=2026352 RepID=UPI0035CA6CA3
MTLAEDIARASPDCADKAMRIVDLARQGDLRPDHQTVQNAIEGNLLDDEMSESRIQTTTSRVLGAIRTGA